MKRTQAKRGPARNNAAVRAHALIDAMLAQMQQAIEDPSRMAAEDWQRMFGKTQNLVVSLQKLVQALGALPQEGAGTRKKPVPEPLEPLTHEEMQLLTDWLKDGRAENKC